MSGPTVRYAFVRRQAPRPRPTAAKQETRKPCVSRAAQVLALAHHIEDLVEQGVFRDYAEAARVLGVTRARMTQIMNLLLLAPGIQEGMLRGKCRLTERRLRDVARITDWSRQEHVCLHARRDPR